MPPRAHSGPRIPAFDPTERSRGGSRELDALREPYEEAKMSESMDHLAESRGNILGMDGLEFVEYATANPEAFGAVLERIGFVLVARHRSRRVFLYRQGTMNIVVDADPDVIASSTLQPSEVSLSALAFRVADARKAYQRLVGNGAWPIPSRAEAMELNIPGVHGVGDSVLYLVDRYHDISVYDVDFDFEPNVDRNPPAMHSLEFHGVVQTADTRRTDVWLDFYGQLFGFVPTTASIDDSYGAVLISPCGKFAVELLELPEDFARDSHWDEAFIRLVFSTSDLAATIASLRSHGFELDPRSTATAALTRGVQGGAQFAFVERGCRR